MSAPPRELLPHEYTDSNDTATWREQPDGHPVIAGRPSWIYPSGASHILLARRELSDVSPEDRRTGPLVLHECRGTFYTNLPEGLGQELLQFDERLEKLMVKVSRGTATRYQRMALAYLLQVLNNYLFCLYDNAILGNAEAPENYPTDEPEEEPMENALKNMREKRRWDRGAKRPEDAAAIEDADEEDVEEAPLPTSARVTRSRQLLHQAAAPNSASGARVQQRQETEDKDDDSDIEFIEIKAGPSRSSAARPAADGSLQAVENEAHEVRKGINDMAQNGPLRSPILHKAIIKVINEHYEKESESILEELHGRSSARPAKRRRH